jgi:8-oxo-dGTP diphosphatase
VWFTDLVVLPHKISTLLYCFDEQDDVLLLHRALEPNKGLWSPCGGKLDTSNGESPYACACREAEEEIGLKIQPHDLHLTGVISEHAYPMAGEGAAHWLMFLFEVKVKIQQVPPHHREGSFRVFKRADLPSLPLPRTDAETIWPLFWRHRGGFFAAHCACSAEGTYGWTVEQSSPASGVGPQQFF